MIVISDLLSPQVLDSKRNWSEIDLGRCIILALEIKRNQTLLD
jgi:hypothetical protein